MTIIFRGYQFPWVLIFRTDTNFRELTKFAKISIREISEIQIFAKIDTRENKYPQKLIAI